MAHEIDPDPFDDLLILEDAFYNEGYGLGIIDGDREGLVEGRLFGLKQGFDKYAAIGNLHGRAMIWAGRLPSSNIEITGDNKEVDKENATKALEVFSVDGKEVGETVYPRMPSLPKSARLENHVRALYALTEPVSLSTENSEEASQVFEERLHQAEAKAKIIEKLAGESSSRTDPGNSLVKGDRFLPNSTMKRAGHGDIEDVTALQPRH